MKNLFKFLFLIVSFSIFGVGVPTASAQPCTNIDIVAGSATIIEIGGSYFYSLKVTNSGSQVTTDVEISVTTNQFTVSDLSSQLIGGTSTTTLNFPITSDVADITTGGGFGVPTTLTFPSGTPAPCEETVIAIISTAGWGCTDPLAINYDATATFNNNSCLESICDLLQVINVEIAYNAFGQEVLKITVLNTSPFDLSFPAASAIINITGSSPVFTVQSGPYDMSMTAVGTSGNYAVIEALVSSPIENLVGALLFISGNITVNAPSIPDVCTIDFTNLPIDISNLGCLDASAFNFDQYATVDNGSCVNDITVTQNVIQPLCLGDYGSVTFTFSGGTPEFSVDYGLLDPDNLLPGNYVFSVTDDTPASIGGPIVQQINVAVASPPTYEVDIFLHADNTTLEAFVNGPTTGWFYWLLDGVVVDSTQVPTYVYTTPGTYTCYVETPINTLGQQCWDYSNGLILTQVGTDEYSNHGFVLYPNPSNGTFTVTLDNVDANTIYAQIFDVQGREVYSIKSDNFNGQLQFNNQELSQGLYQIRVENGNSLYRSKIVIE